MPNGRKKKGHETEKDVKKERGMPLCGCAGKKGLRRAVGGAGFALLSRKPTVETPAKPEPKPIEVQAGLARFAGWRLLLF